MPNLFSVNQNSTAQYKATLKDEAGAVIPSASLSALTLTLYNKSDPGGAIINNRNDQNVLNTADVTVDASGNLTWTLQPADNPVQDAAKIHEDHVALFKFEWQAGTKRGYHEVIIRVVNLGKVS